MPRLQRRPADVARSVQQLRAVVPVQGPRHHLHLVERFSRPDADTLLYEFTVEDPSFTKPWSAALPMKRTDEQLYEYACHEGNEAMFGILGGARHEEKNPVIKK